MKRVNHATAVAYVALFVALGGTSWAALKITGRNVVDGTLETRDLSKKARAALKGAIGPQGEDGQQGQAGSQGQAGPQGQIGPQGAVGPQGQTGPKGDTGAKGDTGEKGDTGTVDTSNFFDKAASDARFLGLTAKADDADRLDGLDSGAFVRNSARTFHVRADGPTAVANGTRLLDAITAAAASPASPAVFLVHAGSYELGGQTQNFDSVHLIGEGSGVTALSTQGGVLHFDGESRLEGLSLTVQQSSGMDSAIVHGIGPLVVRDVALTVNGVPGGPNEGASGIWLGQGGLVDGSRVTINTAVGNAVLLQGSARTWIRDSELVHSGTASATALRAAGDTPASVFNSSMRATAPGAGFRSGWTAGRGSDMRSSEVISAGDGAVAVTGPTSGSGGSITIEASRLSGLTAIASSATKFQVAGSLIDGTIGMTAADIDCVFTYKPSFLATNADCG